MTLKTIAAIRWTALNCYKARFILKLDTDTFLRPNLFLNQLSQLSLNYIYGPHRKPMPPNHDKFCKWYTDPLYFPYKMLPPALSTTYIIPGLLFGKLYQAIILKPQDLTLPALPIEDIYVSLLAFKAKIKILKFPGIVFSGREKALSKYKNTSKSLIMNLSNKTIKKFWDVLK